MGPRHWPSPRALGLSGGRHVGVGAPDPHKISHPRRAGGALEGVNEPPEGVTPRVLYAVAPVYVTSAAA